MCTQKPPYDYSEELYKRYKETFNNYLNDKVAPLFTPYHVAQLPCGLCLSSITLSFHFFTNRARMHG